MLPKINRLKKKKDFEKVFNDGQTIKSDIFFLKTLPNDQKVNRIGFVVSKKIDKRAVIRNKVKRRLREAIKGFLSQLKTGQDYIFIALPKIKDKGLEEIRTTIEKTLKKNKFL